eukprot:CAMPEP_0206243370 /NCGR_PEP_ID=MMETSP0047_2-20121206/17572_1 /ASSEMBLY_ACC=CAM_ASM_000192 /TAXON_ID=195065 /ORGANISM="Chroomonas mesostigmatica_cf, Strain CCMP1168" /LENGTH=748 /DNA_ID=CAMNT_0053668487 /DNA_START=84 /DNA_END=2326 /DNA_ORIENTATION=+
MNDSNIEAALTGVSADDVLGPMSVMSAGFSDSLAQPLKAILPRPYTVGYSGSPRAFFNELMTNQGTGLVDCGSTVFSAQDGTACAYASYLSYMVIIGVLVPVITVTYCCFFGCGRMFHSCRCMGSCCGQPNCGGRKPTSVEYGNEKVVCCCCYFGFFIAVWTIGIIGFLSTNQMGADVQEVLVGLADTTSFPEILKADISTKLAETKTFADTTLAGVNDNLAGRLVVNERVTAFQASVTALEATVTDLRNFVEGNQASGSGVNKCSYMMNNTAVNYTRLGWTSITTGEAVPFTCCTGTDIYSCIKGDHPVGLGTQMAGENVRGSACKIYNVIDYQNGTKTYNPPPTNGKCPCCCGCAVLEYRLAAAKAKLPTSASLEALNQPIDLSSFGGLITNAEQEVDAAVTEFGDTFLAIESVIAPARGYLGNQGLVIGVSISIWALAWLGVVFGCLGLLSSRGCCWWTSYTFGVINVVLFFALFGASSPLVLPFGDLCTGMPRTGEDAVPWLMTFSSTGTLESVDPIVRNLYQDCLVKPNGQLWSVAGVTRANLTSRFDPYDTAKTVPATTRTAALDTLTNTQDFVKGGGDVAALSSNDPTLGVDVQTYNDLAAINNSDTRPIVEDFDLYKQTLGTRVAAVQAGYAVSESVRVSLASATSELMTNLTRMTNSTQQGIVAVTDRILSSADCAVLNVLYEGVRTPLCVKLAKSMDSMWFLFFLMGIIQFPIFIIICRGAKHSMSRRGITAVDEESG